MDGEFDTSIDTSSFDDVTPDTSDIGSFDDASDIVSVMDEAMDTSSLEVSEDLDTSFADTSDDVASIMDDEPFDMDSVEELNVEDTSEETDDLPLEAESEIENLMDDTEEISSEIGEFELYDIANGEFTEELSEQAEITDYIDDTATDIKPETSEFSDSVFSEVSEQDSSEIESLMNEAALDNTSEDAELMNEGETYDIPHDEISGIESDASFAESSGIENFMNETEPVFDVMEEPFTVDSEINDVPYVEDISENVSETDDSSEISDLMNGEEVPETADGEALVTGTDLPNEEEILVENVGAEIPENIEPSPEIIQDVLENIDYNQAFEGLDSYDFDGINYSDNPERLDASLDSFQSDTWENLSIDEQKDAMNGLAEYVEDVIGFENPPEIVYYNNSVDGDYGGYSAATNTLEVNEHMLYENEEAADTIAHELWHAYQHERAENPTSTKDYLYQHGFENYIRPEDDFSAYQDQLVEAEARAFAQQFKDRLNLGRRNS